MGLFIYLLTRVDGLKGALSSTTNWICSAVVFMLLGVVICYVCSLSGPPEDLVGAIANVTKNLLKFIKRALILLVLIGVINVAIPTSKEIAAIYLIPRISNNKEVQKIPSKVFKILNGKLTEWANSYEVKPKELLGGKK